MNPDSIAIPGIPTSFESYKSCKSSSKFGYIPAKECRSHFDLTIFFVRIIFARIWEFSLKLVGTHCSLHFKIYFIISSDDSVQFQSLRQNVIELLHLLESKNFAKTRNPNLKVNFITSCSNSCDLRYTHEKPFIQESPTVLFSNFRSLFRDDKFTVFEFEGLRRVDLAFGNTIGLAQSQSASSRSGHL